MGRKNLKLHSLQGILRYDGDEGCVDRWASQVIWWCAIELRIAHRIDWRRKSREFWSHCLNSVLFPSCLSSHSPYLVEDNIDHASGQSFWIAQWFRYLAVEPEVVSLIPHGASWQELNSVIHRIPSYSPVLRWWWWWWWWWRWLFIAWLLPPV